MADDNSNGFVPEPVPDSIADTELNGLEPKQPDGEADSNDTAQDETTEAAATDTEAESESSEEEATDNKDEQAQSSEEGTETEEQARKRHNDEMARQRIEQRKKQDDFLQAERTRIREYEDSKKQSDEFDADARLKVLEADRALEKIENNVRNLQFENAAAQRDIALFNPNDASYNEKLYNAAIDRFNSAYGVYDDDKNFLGAYDRTGNPVSLGQFLQQEAAVLQEAIGTVQNSTQRQVQQNEAKMRAKVVTPASKGKVASSGDELDDLFERIKDVPLN